MVNTKYKMITIIGNIASGKTTTTDLISRNLPGIKLHCDKFYKYNPFFPSALKDRKRWSFISDLWFLNERVKAIEQHQKYLNSQNLVIDSGIPMSWVFANSRLVHKYYTEAEWKFYIEVYDRMTSILKNSDILIYLKADESFLLEQIVKRNRQFEIQYYDINYLKSLTKSLKRYLNTVKREKIITINRQTTNLLNDKKALHHLLKKIH